MLSGDGPDGVVGGETPGPRIAKPPGRASSVPITTSSELGFFLQLLMAETASGVMTGQSDRASPCVQVSMISWKAVSSAASQLGRAVVTDRSR